MNRYDFNNRDQRKIAPQVLTFLLLGSYLLVGLDTMPYKDKETQRLYLKEWGKKYYLIHKKQMNEKTKKYYQSHKEQIKEYYLTHRERSKKYYLTHKEQIKECVKDYSQTPAGKITSLKHWNKRQRELGFEPLNEYFKGAVAHHIDNKRIVYIPKTIHIKYYAGKSRKRHRFLILQYYGSLENMVAMAKQTTLF